MKRRLPIFPTVGLMLPLCVAWAALGVLFTFPGDEMVWQFATWTLIAGTLLTGAALAFTAHTLARHPPARTRWRIGVFSLGLIYLAAVLLGSV